MSISDRRSVFAARLLPWLLLLPQLVVISVFFFWPAFQALRQAGYQQDAFGNKETWVGLENFYHLWRDPTYLHSVFLTLGFSLALSILGCSAALLLAVATLRIGRASLLFAPLFMLPYAMSPAITGVLWLFMFAPSIGVLSYFLRKLGFDWNFLLNSNHAVALILMASVWKKMSYNFIFYLAGLQAVPQSLLEAAIIDGASPMRRFWTIVFPLLAPTTFFLVITNLVYAFFDTFAIIDATTQGGPGKDTATLVYRVYQDGFIGIDVGSAAAQSIILMVLVMGLTFIQFRWVDRKVHYS